MQLRVLSVSMNKNGLFVHELNNDEAEPFLEGRECIYTCKSLTASAKSPAISFSLTVLQRVEAKLIIIHTGSSHTHYHRTAHVEEEVESVGVCK